MGDFEVGFEERASAEEDEGGEEEDEEETDEGEEGDVGGEEEDTLSCSARERCSFFNGDLLGVREASLSDRLLADFCWLAGCLVDLSPPCLFVVVVAPLSSFSFCFCSVAAGSSTSVCSLDP